MYQLGRYQIAEKCGETKTAGISNTFKLEAEDENKSVLKLHANHHHNGAEVRFSMRVTGVHDDSLDHNIRYSVHNSAV